MKIQLINMLVNMSKEYDDKFDVSSLASPRSLDEYDVNIIDISSKDGIWQNHHNISSSIDIMSDFKSIKSMVEHSNKSKIIYVLPQNVTFYSDYYDYGAKKGYNNAQPIKDNIENVCKYMLPQIIPNCGYSISLLFENTRTIVGEFTYEADFCFMEDDDCVTKSHGSEKCTTIEYGNGLYVTTLNITKDVDSLSAYINYLFSNNKKEVEPEWVQNVQFADDKVQEEIICNSQHIIETEERKIELALQKIQENLKYKSILYTNGEQLVAVVIDILEQILDCDLSKFIDLKKEDFLIKKNTGTLIGEIKGVTSNVKYEHISQVEVHYRGYLDSLEEEQREEYVNQILIMNPFRNKEISQREPINEQQVKLAERNGCLIISTYTLLKLYEKFLNGEISSEQCLDVFLHRKGLLKVEDI